MKSLRPTHPGASTKMTRLYGRCPRGERLVSYVPFGHWKTTTFVGALRHDQITAPCVFDGPMNGETFRAWVEQFLARSVSTILRRPVLEFKLGFLRVEMAG